MKTSYKPSYHLVDLSLWPLTALFCSFGVALYMHSYSTSFTLLSIGLLLLVLVKTNFFKKTKQSLLNSFFSYGTLDLDLNLYDILKVWFNIVISHFGIIFSLAFFIFIFWQLFDLVVYNNKDFRYLKDKYTFNLISFGIASSSANSQPKPKKNKKDEKKEEKKEKTSETKESSSDDDNKNISSRKKILLCIGIGVSAILLGCVGYCIYYNLNPYTIVQQYISAKLLIDRYQIVYTRFVKKSIPYQIKLRDKEYADINNYISTHPELVPYLLDLTPFDEIPEVLQIAYENLRYLKYLYELTDRNVTLIGHFRDYALAQVGILEPIVNNCETILKWFRIFDYVSAHIEGIEHTGPLFFPDFDVPRLSLFPIDDLPIERFQTWYEGV